MEKDELKSLLSNKFKDYRPEPPAGMFEKTQRQIASRKKKKAFLWLIVPTTVAALWLGIANFIPGEYNSKLRVAETNLPKRELNAQLQQNADKANNEQLSKAAFQSKSLELSGAIEIEQPKQIQFTGKSGEVKEKPNTYLTNEPKLEIEKTQNNKPTVEGQSAVALAFQLDKPSSQLSSKLFAEHNELSNAISLQIPKEIDSVKTSTSTQANPPEISAPKSDTIYPMAYRTPKAARLGCYEFMIGFHSYLLNNLETPNSASLIKFQGLNEDGKALSGYGFHSRLRVPIRGPIKLSFGLMGEQILMSRIKENQVPQPVESANSTALDILNGKQFSTSQYFDIRYTYFQVPMDLVYSRSNRNLGIEFSSGLSYVMLLSNKSLKIKLASDSIQQIENDASSERFQSHRFAVQGAVRFMYSPYPTYWIYSGLHYQWQWRNALKPAFANSPNPTNLSFELGIKKQFSCNR